MKVVLSAAKQWPAPQMMAGDYSQPLAHISQDFFALTLLTFWDMEFFVTGDPLVHCRMFSSTPGHYPLDARSSP
jgi:hypothetical protein